MAAIKDWAKAKVATDRGVPASAAADHDAAFELAKRATAARIAGNVTGAIALYEKVAAHPGSTTSEAASARNMAAKLKAGR